MIRASASSGRPTGDPARRPDPQLLPRTDPDRSCRRTNGSTRMLLFSRKGRKERQDLQMVSRSGRGTRREQPGKHWPRGLLASVGRPRPRQVGRLPTRLWGGCNAQGTVRAYPIHGVHDVGGIGSSAGLRACGGIRIGPAAVGAASAETLASSPDQNQMGGRGCQCRKGPESCLDSRRPGFSARPT